MKKHWVIWFWNVLLFSTLPNGQPRGVIVRFWVYLNNIWSAYPELFDCLCFLVARISNWRPTSSWNVVSCWTFVHIWSMDVFLIKAHRSRTCPSPKQRIGWEWISSSCHSSSETRKSFLLCSILLCWNCLSLFCSWFVVYNKKIIFLLSLFLLWFQYPFLSKRSF